MSAKEILLAMIFSFGCGIAIGLTGIFYFKDNRRVSVVNLEKKVVRLEINGQDVRLERCEKWEGK